MFVLLHMFIISHLHSTLHAEESWDKCKRKALYFLPTIQGWCTAEKAERMMDLIYETHPEVCVEVGVYGGSSVYPTAVALKYLDQGLIYAIDPWRNEDCLVGYEIGDPNYNWWKRVDLEDIYDGFLKVLRRHKLNSYCYVLRMRGDEAIAQFPDASIDILHIDGNHTEESALYDAKAYLPKVKQGGYIWFDDANWPTTGKAIDYLLEHCELSHGSKRGDDYLLFHKQS